MARVEKTVFLSYRRVDLFAALLVFKDLRRHGYDVFIDYDGIGSGEFERVIVDNIHARAHFVLLLTPTALDRCVDPADWLRREIEVAIAAGRNIVPVLLRGFSAKAATEKMTGPLEALSGYQLLDAPDYYFDEWMKRLRNKYLAVPIDAVLHPASQHAEQVAIAQQHAATTAKSKTLPNSTSLPAVVGPCDTSAHTGRVPTLATRLRSVTLWLVSSALFLLLLWVLLRDHLLPRQETGSDIAMEQPQSPASASQSAAGEGKDQGPTEPAAQATQGDAFLLGRDGVRQSDSEAVNWYLRSAQQGNARGQLNLGYMYEQGRGGLVKSDTEALKWFRKSAEQGNAVAQANIGAMQEQGQGGLAKSDTEAVKWYRKSAQQGNEVGQARLGVFHWQGKGGLAKSDTEAVKWFKKSAERGYALAQVNLGYMYENGRGGLAKSDAEAFKWYRKSAEQGNAAGQAYMGSMYERGTVVSKDRSEAVKLYRLSASQGNESAVQALRRLGERAP